MAAVFVLFSLECTYIHFFFLFGVLYNFLLWVILYPPPIPNQEKGKQYILQRNETSEELVPSTVLKTAHKFCSEFFYRFLFTPFVSNTQVF